MAMNHQQRRKRAMLFGLLIAITIIAVTMGKPIVTFVFGPAGYVHTVPDGTYAALDWTALSQGQWLYGAKPRVPDSVAKLSGQPVTIQGFLLPLHSAGKSAQFFLAPRPGGCYFCNPPKPSEVIEVNITDGKELELTTWPVTAYGKLVVATGAKGDQTLYTINDAVLYARH